MRRHGSDLLSSPHLSTIPDAFYCLFCKPTFEISSPATTRHAHTHRRKPLQDSPTRRKSPPPRTGVHPESDPTVRNRHRSLARTCGEEELDTFFVPRSREERTWRLFGQFPTYIKPQTILPLSLVQFHFSVRVRVLTRSPIMAMALHGGAGGAPRARASVPDSLFQESDLELEQAKPSANSREEIASVAALGGGDPGEMGSPPSPSVPSPRVAIGDRKFEAGSPPSSRLSRPEPCSALLLQVVKIKEEEEEEEEVVAAAIMADPRDAAAVSPSCSWRTAAEELARPMEGLGEAGPTPFLRKTYEMVSDPGSDRVVSWGSSRDSFVVWDQHEFSKQVLPRYFKHSNFSSFIRQLNTYGFRKIDTDRWEFANEGFQGGKKHLLKNIKRRGKLSKQRKTSRTEVETLKKDQEALKAEILKLREERENSQHEINQVTERVRSAECRHQQMFLFLSKAAKSPNFVQRLIQKKRHKRELDTCESNKESKLLGPDGEATKCLLEAMDPRIQSPNVDCPRISDDSAQMESQPNSVSPEDFEDIQMCNPWPSPVGGGDFRVMQGQMPDQMAAANLSHLSSVFHEMSEKLLGDNVVVGDDAADVEEEEEDDLAVNDTRIYLELEGLIEKPCGWSEYTSELVEQAAVLMP
ncbi:hypothetical protein NL676_033537 [Syzygium grande]|nr:hypothetical protein NL676_033537 [Syzygium grande]